MNRGCLVELDDRPCVDSRQQPCTSERASTSTYHSISFSFFDKTYLPFLDWANKKWRASDNLFKIGRRAMRINTWVGMLGYRRRIRSLFLSPGSLFLSEEEMCFWKLFDDDREPRKGIHLEAILMRMHTHGLLAALSRPNGIYIKQLLNGFKQHQTSFFF